MSFRSLLCGIAILVAILSLSVQAKAEIVYDNGLINGTIDSWIFNYYGTEVSDSFTVASSTDLTGAQVGIMVRPGDEPTSLGWSLGTSPFGSDVSSGNSLLSSSFAGLQGGYYPLYESTFALNGTLAGDTTYWLTLQNGVTQNAGPVYWDETNGPSTAEWKYASFIEEIGSESFQLFSGQDEQVAVVPESSITVMVCMLSVLAMAIAYGWRRCQPATAPAV